jgi:hypothetical protein
MCGYTATTLAAEPERGSATRSNIRKPGSHDDSIDMLFNAAFRLNGARVYDPQQHPQTVQSR